MLHKLHITRSALTLINPKLNENECLDALLVRTFIAECGHRQQNNVINVNNKAAMIN